MRFALFALFLLSLVTLPWWVFMPLGIIIAGLPGGASVAVFGGVVLDAVFGIALPSLGNLSHLYTALFVLVVILMQALSYRVAD